MTRNPFKDAGAKTGQVSEDQHTGTTTGEHDGTSTPPAPPKPIPAAPPPAKPVGSAPVVRAGSRNGPRITVHHGGFEPELKALHRQEMQRYLDGELSKAPSESDVALRLMKLGKRWLEEHHLSSLPKEV